MAIGYYTIKYWNIYEKHKLLVRFISDVQDIWVFILEHFIICTWAQRLRPRSIITYFTLNCLLELNNNSH